jgi:homoaconitase/3-isopropylmalate dehydratase large subunit
VDPLRYFIDRLDIGRMPLRQYRKIPQGNSRLIRERYLFVVPLPGLGLAPAIGEGEVLLVPPGVEWAAPGCSAVTGRRSQPLSCASNAAAGSNESSRNFRDREFMSVPFVSNMMTPQCNAAAMRRRSNTNKGSGTHPFLRCD